MTNSLLTMLVVNNQEFTYPVGGQRPRVYLPYWLSITKSLLTLSSNSDPSPTIQTAVAWRHTDDFRGICNKYNLTSVAEPVVLFSCVLMITKRRMTVFLNISLY